MQRPSRSPRQKEPVEGQTAANLCPSCGKGRMVIVETLRPTPTHPRARGAGANPGAGWIRYVLIPFDSKETNRLITGVETTFEEVTVDSLSFKSKNELGTRSAMLRRALPEPGQRQYSARCNDSALRIAAELPLPRAAASIESP